MWLGVKIEYVIVCPLDMLEDTPLLPLFSTVIINEVCVRTTMQPIYWNLARTIAFNSTLQ